MPPVWGTNTAGNKQHSPRLEVEAAHLRPCCSSSVASATAARQAATTFEKSGATLKHISAGRQAGQLQLALPHSQTQDGLQPARFCKI